jgi:citrate lyase subunit beta-like protein
MGLLNLRAVCEVDRSDISSSSIFRHEGIILGGDDFASSIGATRSRSNAELLYARQVPLRMFGRASYNLQRG